MATARKSKRTRTAAGNHPDKSEQEVADRYGITGRRHLRTDYNPEEIDAATYSGVVYKPKGYYDEWREENKGEPGVTPESHIESTPHGRSILARKKILKPVEVIEGPNNQKILIDGQDRWFLAQQYGIPCPIEVVEGLCAEHARDYIIEINSARRSPTLEERKAQVRHYMEDEESRLKSGVVRLRSAFNKIAVLCNVAHTSVKKIEREHFRDTRWASACNGEQREALNGKEFRTKEDDPESKIDGLFAKLDPKANCTRSEREVAIKLIREILIKYGSLLGQPYIKKSETAATKAEALLKKEKEKEDQVCGHPEQVDGRAKNREEPAKKTESVGGQDESQGGEPTVENREPFDEPEGCIDDVDLDVDETEPEVLAFSGLVQLIVNSSASVLDAARSVGWGVEDQDQYCWDHYSIEDRLFATLGFTERDAFRLCQGVAELMTHILGDIEARGLQTPVDEGQPGADWEQPEAEPVTEEEGQTATG